MNEIYKTTKGKVLPISRTRASTFANHAKPTLKPKFAKELALLASLVESSVQLEKEKKPPSKKLKPSSHYLP